MVYLVPHVAVMVMAEEHPSDKEENSCDAY
jgi:hypothetical protein